MEGEILQALKINPGTDFAEILTKNKSSLMSYALHLSGDRDFAEELVQITWCRAWQSRDNLLNVNSIKPWLNKILFREYVRIISSYRHQNTWYYDQASELEEVCNRQNDAALVMEERLALQSFICCAMKIPELYSAPLALCAEGYNHQEIAQQLNIPAATALTRIHRARQLVRQKFAVQELE